MPIKSPLSRCTTTTLDRLARIGATIARERSRARADGLRLMRLNALALRLKEQLRRLTAERAMRVASAPRLRPRPRGADRPLCA